MAQARPDRLRLLERQLELRKPAAPLDPEQVDHWRAAHKPAHEHRVDLVLGARAGTHQLLTPRQTTAHHPAALIR